MGYPERLCWDPRRLGGCARQYPSQLYDLVLHAQVNTKTSSFFRQISISLSWVRVCPTVGPRLLSYLRTELQIQASGTGAEVAGRAGLGTASPRPHASLQLHAPPKTNELEEAFPLPKAHTREVSVRSVGQELKNEEERKTDRKIHLPL